MRGHYKTVKERMEKTLRRKEVEATGKPLYFSYDQVPDGLLSPTKCRAIHQPVLDGEEPIAYVLNRSWLGYLPLYRRKQNGGN